MDDRLKSTRTGADTTNVTDHVAEGTGWWDVDPWLRPRDENLVLAVQAARATFAGRDDLWLVDD